MILGGVLVVLGTVAGLERVGGGEGPGAENMRRYGYGTGPVKNYVKVVITQCSFVNYVMYARP